MNEMRVMGIVFIVLGILMATFRRSLGIGFCRIGKRIWRDNRLGVPSRFTDWIYDESKAPGIMLFLGIVFAVQGAVFWLVLSHE